MSVARSFVISFMLAATLSLSGVRGTHAQIAADPLNPAQAIKQGDLADAARQARLLAETGVPDGQFMLSLFYWHGIALPQSYSDALNWITLSAVSGHRRAPAARLAMLQTIEPPQPQRSMEWARAYLTQRAEAGDNDALLHLALSYSSGFGFENATEAYFWYNLSVASGNIAARKQRNILVAALKPGDVVKAQERAKEWFGQWRSVNSQGASASEPTEQQIVSDENQSGASLGAVVNEYDQERGRNAPDLMMQGGSIEQR